MINKFFKESKNMELTKQAQMYEGKAKKVFATEDENYVIVSYKDDATANDGLKKGTISGKGVINNQMSNFLMQLLEKEGVPTHFVKEINERDTIVKKVSIVPLEVIIRNISAYDQGIDPFITESRISPYGKGSHAVPEQNERNPRKVPVYFQSP